MKIVYLIFALVLLVYMAWPAPGSITDFPPLPDSVKSTLEGDTIQVPNVSAYFSNHYRDYATSFYEEIYWKKTGLPFPPLRLNHPPEYAFDVIKKNTDSTYLEEFVYPLRGSVFINGFEPLEQNGQPKFEGAIKFELGEGNFDTKATLRYYPTPLWIRLLIWGGIIISLALIWKLGKNIFK